MSLECVECEHDVRGKHDWDCGLNIYYHFRKWRGKRKRLLVTDAFLAGWKAAMAYRDEPEDDEV